MYFQLLYSLNLVLFFRKIVSAMNKWKLSPESSAVFNPIRIVATDSWDIVRPSDQVPVTQETYVVLPESTQGQSILGSKDIAGYLQNLDPKVSKNPWLLELWSSVFNCSTLAECASFRVSSIKAFEVDTKANFVVEAVVTFSEAVEKCFRQEGETQCVELIQKTDRFFREYLMQGWFAVCVHD